MPKPPTSLIFLLAVGLGGCGETSTLPIIEGIGPNPVLPEPSTSLVPIVNIAPAVGWPKDGRPIAAPGTQVNAFAEHLDHPRWLYVLPNEIGRASCRERVYVLV